MTDLCSEVAGQRWAWIGWRGSTIFVPKQLGGLLYIVAHKRKVLPLLLLLVFLLLFVLLLLLILLLVLLFFFVLLQSRKNRKVLPIRVDVHTEPCVQRSLGFLWALRLLLKECLSVEAKRATGHRPVVPLK